MGRDSREGSVLQDRMVELFLSNAEWSRENYVTTKLKLGTPPLRDELGPPIRDFIRP